MTGSLSRAPSGRSGFTLRDSAEDIVFRDIDGDSMSNSGSNLDQHLPIHYNVYWHGYAFKITSSVHSP